MAWRGGACISLPPSPWAQHTRSSGSPRVHTLDSGPPPTPEDAHLLMELVLVALPGQLILVLGPLGRERAGHSSPGEGGRRPKAGWTQTWLGAGASDKPPTPTCRASALPAHPGGT